MGLFTSKNKTKNLHWIPIHSLEELENAMDNTKEKSGLFFKHSTRCNISKMIFNRLERQWEEKEECNLYYIDLLQHRDVSNKMSELTQIEHQSPQAILIRNKEVIFNASHNGISASRIQNSI